MTKSALQFRRFKSNSMAFVFMAYYRPNHKFHKKKNNILLRLYRAQICSFLPNLHFSFL